jgi:hypothetical protein
VPIREVVSQISPPIRILLVLTVAVLGVYMLFLRPKTEEAPPVTPTATPAGTVETAAAQAPAEPTAAAAAKPADDLKGLPKPVRAAIRKDKVLVLLFWNPKASDDRAVHKALGQVERWDGRVFVHAAPLKKISKYGRIARGVNVEQSPTVVVADRDLRAETLVGYVDRRTIDQAVVDALRNSTGQFTSSYLRTVDKVCVRHSNRMATLPGYYVDNPREADRRIATYEKGFAKFATDFKAIKPPKRWRAFHNASVADIAAYSALLHEVSTALTPKSATPAAVGVINGADAKVKPIEKRANSRFDGHGLFRCGSQF